MANILKFLFIITVTMLFSVTVYAGESTDLPLNMNALSDMPVASDSVTAHYGVDLFTDKENRITEQIALWEQANYEKNKSSLRFNAKTEPMPDIQSRLQATAQNGKLFSKPVSYQVTSGEVQNDPGQRWLTVVLLASCGVGGFILAYAMILRKRGREK